MTVKELLNACEMRIDYVDIDLLGSNAFCYGLSESRAQMDFCTYSVVIFDYDANTYTLVLTVKD